MKNINSAIFKIACKQVGINFKNFSYYSSGKCSDLFLDSDNKIVLKIMKWHIQKDSVVNVFNKMKEKINFIRYLENNRFPIIGPIHFNNSDFVIFKFKKQIYVAYMMPFVETNDEAQNISIEDIAKLMRRFHDLSRKYTLVNIHLSWKDDFYSVLSLCQDKELYNTMINFYEQIEVINKNKDKGFIHFDLNKNNFLSTTEGVFMIDFDTITYGWYAMDIAGYLYSISVLDFQQNLYIDNYKLNDIYLKFMETYNNKAIIDYLDTIDLFMKYRRLFLYIIQKNSIDNNNKNKSLEIKNDIINNKKFISIYK